MTIFGFPDYLGLRFGQFVFIDPFLRNPRNIGLAHFHPFTLFHAFVLFYAELGENGLHAKSKASWKAMIGILPHAKVSILFPQCVNPIPSGSVMS
jgi:hypothetical protein